MADHRVHTRSRWRAAGLRRMAIGAVAWAAMLLSAATAGAVTVGFDSAPAVVGASANTIYATSPGVIFNPQGAVLPGAERSCGTVVVASPLAASAPNGALLQCGGGEFPLPPVLNAIFTAQTYQRVSLSVGSGAPRTVQLSGYDSLGRVAAQTGAVQIPAGTRQTLTVTAGDSEISGILLRTLSDGSGGGIVIDDLDLPPPALPGAPTFQIARVGAGTVDVIQGRSASTEVALYRINGSAGEVDWDVTGLPPGVTSTRDATPNGVRIGFLARADAVPTADPVSVTVTATPTVPGTGSGTRSITIPVGVRPAIEVTSSARSAQAPSCTATPLSYRIAPHAGPARWAVNGLPSGVSAFINGVPVASVIPTADGATRPASLTFTTSRALGAEVAVDVGIVSTGGAYTGFRRLTLGPGRFEVTISPSSGRPPEALRPGTTVTLSGDVSCAGLGGGTALRFGNDRALASFVTGPGGTLTAQVPRLATTGPIGFVPNTSSPGIHIDGPVFTVQGVRERTGFAFANYTPNLTFANMDAAFGRRATRISVNSCGMLGRDCTVITPIPDPFALLVWGMASLTIGGPSGGVCFGISRTALQLRGGGLDARAFAPGTASVAFDLTGAGGATGPLIDRVNANQLTVISAEALTAYLAGAAGNALTATPASLRARVEEGLRAGRYPALSLREGGSISTLHVVLAYDVTDAPEGGYHLWVYDSNMPFTTGAPLRGQSAADATDEREPTGAMHADRMERSRIWVRPNGSWSMPSSGMSAGGGSLGNIVVFDDPTTPAQPTLPTSAQAASKAFVYLLNTAAVRGVSTRTAVAQQAGDGGWDLEQVTAAGRTLFGEDGLANTDPATALRAAVWQPPVGVPSAVTGVVLPTDTGVFTVTASGRGGATRQTQTLLGPGLVATVESAPGTDQTDSATLDSERGALRFAPDGVRQVTGSVMVRARDGRALSLHVEGRASAGGLEVAVSPATGNVTFGSDVAGPLAVRLSSVSRSGASAVRTTVAVRAGEGVTIPGSAFRSLDGAVSYRTTRGRRGRLATTRLAGPRPKVRIVSAAVRGRRLVVRARVGTAATGAVGVTLRAGSRQESQTLRSTGRNALVVFNVPRPRRGTVRLQVIATRLDSASGVPVASAGQATRSVRIP